MIIVFLCHVSDTRLRKSMIEEAMDNACDVKALSSAECANFHADPGEHLDHAAHIYVCPVRGKAVRPYTIQDIAGGMEPIYSSDFVFAFDYEDVPDPFWGGTTTVNAMRCLKNRYALADPAQLIKGFDMRPFLAAGRKKWTLKLVESATGAYHTLVSE